METQIKVPHTEYLKISIRRGKGETLESIAKPYGVTRERIRQILEEHFPGITAKVAGRARKNIFDREREKQTRPCACGCGTAIPVWKRDRGYWSPARRYVPGHAYLNCVSYERTPESRARTSEVQKRHWAAGKYDNKILKKTIIMRRKLWKILREHPEGMTTTDIIKATGINRSTLNRWIKLQQYIKLDAHRTKRPGRPYIVKLAKESPVNLEDERVSRT